MSKYKVGLTLPWLFCHSNWLVDPIERGKLCEFKGTTNCCQLVVKDKEIGVGVGPDPDEFSIVKVNFEKEVEALA